MRAKHRIDHLTEIELHDLPLPHVRLHARELEKLGDQLRETTAVVLAGVEQIALLVVDLAENPLAQDVEAHDDRRQRRPELVRDLGEEIGLEAVELLEMGDVAEDRHDAAHRRAGLQRHRADGIEALGPLLAHHVDVG